MFARSHDPHQSAPAASGYCRAGQMKGPSRLTARAEDFCQTSLGGPDVGNEKGSLLG
jgi:hypothetical protein